MPIMLYGFPIFHIVGSAKNLMLNHYITASYCNFLSSKRRRRILFVTKQKSTNLVRVQTCVNYHMRSLKIPHSSYQRWLYYESANYWMTRLIIEVTAQLWQIFEDKISTKYCPVRTDHQGDFDSKYRGVRFSRIF